MTFTASCVFEVEVGASDANGGGFDPGVAGMATNLAVSSANTAAPVASSATYNFVAGDVGNWLYIKSGTSSIPGWYKIASVASNQATLDAAIGHAVLANGTPNTALGCGTVASLSTITWSVDYSQSTSAFFALSDMVIDGTTNTKFTSAAHPAADNLIGNIINVTAGTGFTVQRVAIVSRTTTVYTVDKSLGTLSSTGGTGNLGGAFASPALPFSITASNNTVFIKSGAYTISSTSVNAANGIVSVTSSGTRAEGYGSVRGDLGTAPVSTASGISGVTVFSATGASNFMIRNLTIDCASLSTMRGFSIGSGTAYALKALNATNTGISATFATLVKCWATGCSSTGGGIFGSGTFCDCESYSNTVPGFIVGSNSIAANCISYANSGASADGFQTSSFPAVFNNCSAYNNGRDGFRLANNIALCINCISEGNASNGYTLSGLNGLLFNCAAYNNSTNFSVTGTNALNVNPITGTASFFVAASSGNFALNANAGGGALARGAGIPGLTPDGLSTGYLDIGAIQSPPLYPPARAFTRAA